MTFLLDSLRLPAKLARPHAPHVVAVLRQGINGRMNTGASYSCVSFEGRGN